MWKGPWLSSGWTSSFGRWGNWVLERLDELPPNTSREKQRQICNYRPIDMMCPKYVKKRGTDYLSHPEIYNFTYYKTMTYVIANFAYLWKFYYVSVHCIFLPGNTNGICVPSLFPGLPSPPNYALNLSLISPDSMIFWLSNAQSRSNQCWVRFTLWSYNRVCVCECVCIVYITYIGLINTHICK